VTLSWGWQFLLIHTFVILVHSLHWVSIDLYYIIFDGCHLKICTGAVPKTFHTEYLYVCATRAGIFLWKFWHSKFKYRHLIVSFTRDRKLLSQFPKVYAHRTIQNFMNIYWLQTIGNWVLPGVKRPGCGVEHPSVSNADVKARVELYLYSPLPWAFMVCSRVNCTSSVLTLAPFLPQRFALLMLVLVMGGK